MLAGQTETHLLLRYILFLEQYAPHGEILRINMFLSHAFIFLRRSYANMYNSFGEAIEICPDKFIVIL